MYKMNKLGSRCLRSLYKNSCFCFLVCITVFTDFVNGQCSVVKSIDLVENEALKLESKDINFTTNSENVCTWILKASNDSLIFVQITTQSIDCIAGRLRIDLSEFTACSSEKTTFGLQAIPSNEVTITYRYSNDADLLANQIFTIDVLFIHFSAAPKPSCGDKLEAASSKQYIYSPAFPDNYPDSQDCVYTITAKETFGLHLIIEFMDIEDDSTCSYDFLIISAGSKKVYCSLWNFTPPQHLFYNTSGVSVDVQFKSDDSTSYRGFALSYRAVQVISSPEISTPVEESRSSSVVYSQISTTVIPTIDATLSNISSSNITMFSSSVVSSQVSTAVFSTTDANLSDIIPLSQTTIQPDSEQISSSFSTEVITTHEMSATTMLETSAFQDLQSSTKLDDRSIDIINETSTKMSTGSFITSGSNSNDLLNLTITESAGSQLKSVDNVTTKFNFSFSYTKTVSQTCGIYDCVIPLIVAVVLLLGIMFFVIILITKRGKTRVFTVNDSDSSKGNGDQARHQNIKHSGKVTSAI